MQTYLSLLRDGKENDTRKPTRAILPSTGQPVAALSLFGRQLRFDLAQGFPAVTTKRLFWKGVVQELLWFLRGESNVASLQAEGVHIWDEWADKDGELGPVYGVQWRRWRGADGNTIDQIQDVVNTLRRDPNSRRMLVSAWNVAELSQMALPPCHALFQFYVSDDKLSCQLYQRSADIFLGVPFNIASYALLTYLIAHVTGLQPGDFVHTFGDVHLYENHLSQAEEQLSREPYPAPTLWLNPEVHDIFSFTGADIKLRNYQHHATLTAEVAV